SVRPAVPALAELRAEMLTAVALPVRTCRLRPEQQLLRHRLVALAQEPQLGLALGRRQVAHGGREVLVLHYRANAGGIQHVARVMHGGEVPGDEDELQRLNSA